MSGKTSLFREMSRLAELSSVACLLSCASAPTAPQPPLRADDEGKKREAPSLPEKNAPVLASNCRGMAKDTADIFLGNCMANAREAQCRCMRKKIECAGADVSLSPTQFQTWAAECKATPAPSLEVALPEPPGPRPSLLYAFREGRPQEIAGEGTTYPPSCDLTSGVLTVRITDGFRGYAGCYIELPQAMDLRAFQDGVLYVELDARAPRLEIKIESGPAGTGRGEMWLYRKAAEAGPHEYAVPVGAGVIEEARRLVVAVTGEPSGPNVILVRTSRPAGSQSSR